jgi:hypothetical protein
MARIAAKQFGVISLAQLFEIGFTYAEVKGLVRDGHLHPLHRGVYVVGHRTISNRAHLIGGLLALGPASFLSHRGSAAARGLRAVNTREIELTVVADRTPRPRPGLIVHRTAKQPHRDEIQVYNGLRVSSVPRMLIEVSLREGGPELDRLITASVQRGFFNVDKLKATLARHDRRPGIAKTREALAQYIWTPRRKSDLERDFAKWLATDPSIPTPVGNERLGPWEIDFLWPDLGIAVELDGRPWHIAIRDMDKDRAKDIWLQKRGMVSMRITDFRFEHDKAGVSADLHDFLRMRRAA